MCNYVADVVHGVVSGVSVNDVVNVVGVVTHVVIRGVFVVVDIVVAGVVTVRGGDSVVVSIMVGCCYRCFW